VDAVLFREVQYPAWWACLILVTTGVVLPVAFIPLARVLARRSKPGGCILLGAGLVMCLLSVAIFVAFGVMTTEVTAGGLRVSFGFWPSHVEFIPAGAIRSVEAVQYDPGEYGGWGIRARSPQDRVLSQSGDRAVKLQLDEGRRLLVGSQESEALAEALRPLVQPAGP
jgi:hypothetical protein